MARFGSIGTQYFDNVGDPLSSGYLYFYEQGTTTDKTTYSDLAQTIANTQPVRLTAAGRQPTKFFRLSSQLDSSASTEVLNVEIVNKTINFFIRWSVALISYYSVSSNCTTFNIMVYSPLFNN
jgi:hypothetical protein